ncbi:golgin subfamily B member 1 [Dorcoceras hygrometricum]|uniref:Golgin subfamily B member 1 n=1 Tax=Dorcoceras hygrometricum TaxID=472368 RepID=A0A2Z7CHF9_9LAMI|nr:golgin subfamily B member 1 [Dorcoceras hygrometricum]
MHMPCKGSRLRPRTGSKGILTATQQLDNSNSTSGADQLKYSSDHKRLIDPSREMRVRYCRSPSSTEAYGSYPLVPRRRITVHTNLNNKDRMRNPTLMLTDYTREMSLRSSSSSSATYEKGMRRNALARGVQSYHSRFRRSYLLTAMETKKLLVLSNLSLLFRENIVEFKFDKISDLVETLQTQMRIHGLKWNRICSSGMFEGENRDRGAVIARSKISTRSLCWLRTKTLAEGSWVIQEGNDLRHHLPKQTVPLTIELSPQRQLDDTLAPVSEFFKVLHNQWPDVCIAVVQFSTVGSLQPVGSHIFCRDIVVFSTVIDIAVDASDFVGVFRRGTYVLMIISESSSSSSGSAHPDSPPTSADSSLHFNEYDIPPEEESAPDQLILPSTTTDISASLATLRESISRLIANQTRDSRKSDCGRNRQSGPRPEPRLLRQPALEALTNSTRTDSPRRIGRNEFRRLEAAAVQGGGGGVC